MELERQSGVLSSPPESPLVGPLPDQLWLALKDNAESTLGDF